MEVVQPFIMPDRNVGMEILKYANERGDLAYAQAYQQQKDKYLVGIERQKQVHDKSLLDQKVREIDIMDKNGEVTRGYHAAETDALKRNAYWDEQFINQYKDKTSNPTNRYLPAILEHTNDASGRPIATNPETLNPRVERKVEATDINEMQPANRLSNPNAPGTIAADSNAEITSATPSNGPAVSVDSNGVKTYSVPSQSPQKQVQYYANAVGDPTTTNATVFGTNLNGTPDALDNGRGAFGANTRDANFQGISLPKKDIIGMYGSLAAAHRHIKQFGAPVFNVFNPKTGKSIQAPLADIGPGDKQVARGVGLDLTGGAARALGSTGLDKMQYSLASGGPLSTPQYTDGSISTSSIDPRMYAQSNNTQGYNNPSDPSSFQDYSAMVDDTLRNSTNS